MSYEDSGRGDERRGRRHLPAEEQALWRAARAGLIRDDGPVPAPDRLAAYLDGRLDETERARVETELAGSADGRALLLACREALTAGPDAPAPAPVIARAQGLVRAPAEIASAGEPLWQRLAERLFGSLRAVGWVGAASLCLLLGILSFELGAVGYRHVAASPDRVASYDSADYELADEGSWQLLDVL